MRTSTILSTLALATALTACAAVKAERVDEKEARLSAAGFVRNQANTPAKLAKAQALPQNKMFIVTKGSSNYYIYADAAGCTCVFAGNEAAYQQYQALRIQQNVAQEDVLAAELNQESNLELATVWGPGFYY